MTAYAYLRRSRVDTRRPGEISYEQQVAAIRSLAERHGDDPDELVLIEDWGKSGRAEKQHLRVGFAQLEAAVADGRASAIYAYSANRLARSLEALARLAKSCEAAGIPVRCADGYSPDVSTSTGRMVLGILGSVYTWQAEWTAERMVEATRLRRSRGDHLGPAPYGFRIVDGKLAEQPLESFDTVVAAYQASRSIQATARKLNVDRVPTRTGRPWTASTIRGMLARRAPELLPRRTRPGRQAERTFLLSGLLWCGTCQGVMTGRTASRGRDHVSYECKRARDRADHPRPMSIAESKVLPWVVDEVARLSPHKTAAELGTEEHEAERAELEVRRARVVDAYLDGTIDKARRDSELAAIDGQLDRLDAVTPSVIRPIPKRIAWDRDPAIVNKALRAIIATIELDGAMLPVRADWHVPEWRSAEVAAA